MDTPTPPDLPERVAALEAICVRLESRLDRIEQILLRLVTDTKEEFGKIRADIAFLRGQVSQLPTMWQLITYTLGAQVTLAGLLFGAYKLGH
jgi:hypothetical protein